MRSLAWIVVASIAGCSYTPGSFSYPARRFPGQRVTVGCLDIAVDRRADLKDINQAAVVDYQFGNRCDGDVMVDLTHVRIYGRTADGVELALTAYDPGLEMKPMKLGGRQAGGEAIAYPTTEPLTQVCVDAASIVETPKEARWLCFGSHEPLAAMDEEETP